MLIKRHFLLKYMVPVLIGCSSYSYAESITWIAENPNNNMSESNNWNPNTIPGNSDNAIFNSTLTGVDTNPTQTLLPFYVSTFVFPFDASIFNFSFTNQSLTFNGPGITGSKTNSTINVTNTNNSSFPGDLISFLGVTGTSGSSIITCSNSGTLTGNLSSTSIGSYNSNLHSTGAFTINDGGSITASNIGNDSTTGTGNNGIANTGASQFRFDQSFTAGDNVTVSISNEGIFSGTNTVQGDAVSIINGSQFISSGAFEAGDNFNCTLQNTGNDSSQGVGLSNIGQLNAAQMILQTTGNVGENCSITLSNTGINSSQTTTYADFIGYLNDQQFYVGSTFEAEDNFTLTVSNTGTDTSNGYGNCQIALINSNSGSTGNQILFQQGCTLANHASISATNSGNYSGTNTNGGSNIAGMNLQQIAIGDSTAPGSYAFAAGDNFSLRASNIGIDSSNGTGGNAVGDVSEDQITFFTPVTLGTDANITISNSGNFSGHASATYVNVGSTGGCQLNCVSGFSATDNFTLNLTNSGTNTGSGVGDFFVGDLITGQQASFQNSFVIGNNASMTITNSGFNFSNTTANNQVGSFMGYGKQFLAKNQFQTDDGLVLEITNTGFDDSTGPGGNFVGFMNNDTVDNSGSQIHLTNGGTVGNNASITLFNTGTYQGSNTTSGNAIGVLAGQQWYSVSDFHAGNNFDLNVTNSGLNNASGQNYNSMGCVNSSQVQFGGACILGNSASIVLSNSGTNNDTTGTLNSSGVINGAQLLVEGNLNAGTALKITANNTSINGGDSSNFVGHLNGSQIAFAQNCTLNDGSVIRAFNSGTVTTSQIVFGQGYNIVSGKVNIQAVNQGTLGSYGIDIEGSNAGGNANIFLSNSSLNVGATLPTFTIAELVGDSGSFVQSLPQLIINTDASTQAEFSGVIQDYPENSSTLLKMGAGTQILSGVNTYTGLTTVQEGVLILNGSIAGDVETISSGMFKGNGTIAGTFTHSGMVSPGQSIGTLYVGTYVSNNGTYGVEVNGQGQSDLIDVSGAAIINGGTVVVSSVDGTFRFQEPYTILTAEGGVTGAFTSATSLALVNPTLTYDLDNIYLTLHSSLINAAQRYNQLGVATNLDAIVNPNAAQSLLIGAIANLPLPAAQEALERLSGFQYTNDVLVADISTRRFLRRLYDPLRSLVAEYDGCAPSELPCYGWIPWLETGGGFTNLHGNIAHKVTFDSYQVTYGLQKAFSCDFTFGVAGSYEYDKVTYRDGRADRHAEFVSLYGLYRPSIVYGLFNLVYGHSSSRSTRLIEAGGLLYQAHSKPNFNNFTYYGEFGFDVEYDCGLIQPFLGVQSGRNWRRRIKESYAEGFGLTVDKHAWSTISSRLGVHLSTPNFYDAIDTFFDVAWNQLWSSNKNTTVGSFQQFGDSFTIYGNKPDRYSIDYALTFTTCLCNGLKGYIELDGEWWEHANTFNAVCGIVFSW